MFCYNNPKSLHVAIGAHDQDWTKLPEQTGVRTQSNSKMEGVIDKDQRLSEGRVEAEDGKLDFEESSDDAEVELLLPRNGADER